MNVFGLTAVYFFMFHTTKHIVFNQLLVRTLINTVCWLCIWWGSEGRIWSCCGNILICSRHSECGDTSFHSHSWVSYLRGVSEKSWICIKCIMPRLVTTPLAGVDSHRWDHLLSVHFQTCGMSNQASVLLEHWQEAPNQRATVFFALSLKFLDDRLCEAAPLWWWT